MDTPGSQKPRDTLRARMQEQVLDSLSESDVILLLFDAEQASEDLGAATATSPASSPARCGYRGYQQDRPLAHALKVPAR